MLQWQPLGLELKLSPASWLNQWSCSFGVPLECLRQSRVVSHLSTIFLLDTRRRSHNHPAPAEPTISSQPAPQHSKLCVHTCIALLATLVPITEQ